MTTQTPSDQPPAFDAEWAFIRSGDAFALNAAPDTVAEWGMGYVEGEAGGENITRSERDGSWTDDREAGYQVGRKVYEQRRGAADRPYVPEPRGRDLFPLDLQATVDLMEAAQDLAQREDGPLSDRLSALWDRLDVHRRRFSFRPDFRDMRDCETD